MRCLKNFSKLKCKCVLERKRILKQVKIDTDMFITSLEKAARLILDQKEKLEKEGWSSLHFKINSYYDSDELIVMGMRLETDGEYNARVLRQKKKEASLQKKENKQRER